MQTQTSEHPTGPDAPGDQAGPGKTPFSRHVQNAVLILLLVLPILGMALVYRHQMSTTLFWVGVGLVGSLGLAVLLARHAHRMAFFEEILLVEVFVASLVGIGLTNVSPQSGLRFWLAMSLLMAIAALVMGAVRRVGGKVGGKVGGGAFLLTQIVHWVATLLAIGAIYLLFRAGRLNYDNTALVVLLVLGLSTFLDGYRISWRFALIGVLVATTAVMAAYVEQFTWPMMLVAMSLLVIVAIWEWLRHRRARRNRAGPVG